MEGFENQAVHVAGGADELLVIFRHGGSVAVAGSPDGNGFEAGVNKQLKGSLGGQFRVEITTNGGFGGHKVAAFEYIMGE